MAASSEPYGFTLAVWGSGAVAMSQLGSPAPVDALLLVAGAIAGFVAVEVAARGSLRIQPVTADSTPIAIAGNAHVLSAGGAILAVWAVLQVVSGAAGWALTGFVASVTYLVGAAVQKALATRGEG